MIVRAVRKGFIDKSRAALVDFMEHTLRIVRWYIDPANQKAAAEIAAKVTKQLAVFTAKDYYRDADMLPQPQRVALAILAAVPALRQEGLREPMSSKSKPCRPRGRAWHVLTGMACSPV